MRTRNLGVEVEKRLLAAGIAAKHAREYATAIAGVFGSVSKKVAPQTDEVVVLGREEWDAVSIRLQS